MFLRLSVVSEPRGQRGGGTDHFLFFFVRRPRDPRFSAREEIFSFSPPPPPPGPRTRLVRREPVTTPRTDSETIVGNYGWGFCRFVPIIKDPWSLWVERREQMGRLKTGRETWWSALPYGLPPGILGSKPDGSLWFHLGVHGGGVWSGSMKSLSDS